MMLNTISSHLTFRNILIEDKSFLLDLYTSTREDLTSSFPKPVYEKIIAFQFEMQDSQYKVSYPNGYFFLILWCGEKIGRIYLAEDSDKYTVVEISFEPNYRYKGFGSTIFNELIRLARENNKEIQLQVARSNTATNFYNKLGFSIMHTSELHNLMRIN